MIAVKDTKSVSFLKLEPFIPTNSTNDFILFDPFIVSVLVSCKDGQKQWLLTFSLHCLCSSTSHLFTSIEPPARLLIDFKNSKWLTVPILASYYALLCICYCFSDLIGLLSVTWLSLLYKFTRFFYYLFSVSLWRRANARNVRLYYLYWQYTNLFIFRFRNTSYGYDQRSDQS